METQFIELKEGRIAYDITGTTGPLVICVPGMGDLRDEYRFLAQKLSKGGYRVVTMDIRGHGESSIHWSDFTVRGVGNDIIDLIKHMQNGPAVIIGTSMAAGAAVVAAAESPDLVRGLVLIGPFVRGEGNPFVKLVFRAILSRPWGPANWIKYYSSLYPTHKPDDFAEYTAALRSNLEERGRLEALVKMMLAKKTASEQRLEKVQAPVMVIMGDKDPDFKKPEEEAKWVADKLHGELHMIEGAGHYPHAEFPKITTPMVVNFMKTINHVVESPEGEYARP